MVWASLWKAFEGVVWSIARLNYLVEEVTIARRIEPRNADTSYVLHRSPYGNFPDLRSHVHPYAAIINAVPKLGDNMTRLPSIPEFVNTSYYFDLLHIYGRLTEAYRGEEDAEALVSQQHDSSTPPPASNASRSRGTRSSSRIAAASLPQNHPEPSAAHTRVDSTEQDDFDDLLDACDCRPLNASSTASTRPSLSISTPDGSVLRDEGPNHTDPPLTTAHIPCARQDVVGWVAGVEQARQQNYLMDPENDESPEAIKYAEEPARATPTHDWHHWTSEFAPWWMVLPEPPERGIISSNNWTEIRNRPPLTRRLSLDISDEYHRMLSETEASQKLGWGTIAEDVDMSSLQNSPLLP
ncbi:hypothetical protein RhiJN_25807 [Ceratobasidium sp. AG-Ba]|nr:hypothetical protein RhiJN_25807 [Ceratobasidium sp. AG-Ba]